MEKKPIHVRDAQESERHGILDLTLVAYAEFEALVPPPMWTIYRENIVATLAEKASAKLIVAEQDGAIVGSVLLYLQGTPSSYPGEVAAPADLNWPEVRLLAVRPGMRGKGIATALMDECIRRSIQDRAHYLGLHTLDFMQSAVRLYERLGFQRAPEVDFYGGETLIMGYRLSLDASSQVSPQ